MAARQGRGGEEEERGRAEVADDDRGDRDRQREDAEAGQHQQAGQPAERPGGAQRWKAVIVRTLAKPLAMPSPTMAADTPATEPR